jgi:hypothetical protein
MIVLSELRDNYWGAKAAYRLFEQAEARLHNRPEHHRAKSIASDYPPSDNLENQFTSVPFLIPGGSSSMNTLPVGSQVTQQTVSDDFVLGPENLFPDEFALGSIFNADSYFPFDAATMLQPRDLGTGYCWRSVE